MTDYTRAEAAKLDEIERLQAHIERLELRATQSKRKAALHKRELDEANEELHELIRSDVVQLSLPGMESGPIIRKMPTWADSPVSVAVVNKDIVAKLAEHGINNLGQLASYTRADYSLTQIGLTEHEEAKVVESLQVFWSEEPGVE